MRQLVRDFVALCAETIELKQPIYEFGALNVEGQEGFADLREYFPGKEYIGADMREGLGVDVVLDLHSIDLPDETAGTVISVETLEHVRYPEKAVDEMLRVLRSDGELILTTVLNFPIHDYPADYWRFTPETMRSMLSGAKYALVDWCGEEPFPHTVVAIAFKYQPDPKVVDALKTAIEAWKARWNDARETAPWTASAAYVPLKELEEQVRTLETRCQTLETALRKLETTSRSRTFFAKIKRLFSD